MPPLLHACLQQLLPVVWQQRDSPLVGRSPKVYLWSRMEECVHTLVCIREHPGQWQQASKALQCEKKLQYDRVLLLSALASHLQHHGQPLQVLLHLPFHARVGLGLTRSPQVAPRCALHAVCSTRDRSPA